MPVAIGSWIGQYRVLELLGSGGMGEVYLVEESGTGRRRAMKTLRDGGPDSEVWRRFVNEGRVQHEVSHPNIAAFHEMFLFEERPCLVMEFVDGETLFSRIQRTGPMAVEETRRVLEQLCDALAYLHGKSIMHRDIKSANIKISSSGAVKLLDFGIARSQRTRGMTVTGTVMGTPEYLAPEQIAGMPADDRSEVWSLGLLGYEMLAGSLPFRAADDLSLFRLIRETDPQPPSAFRADVPAAVDGLVMRCLEKRPSRRYPSAAAVRSALGRSRQSSAVTASLMSVVQPWLARIQALPPRTRMAVLAVPAVFLVAVFALSSTTPEDVRSITVDVVEGRADVYVDGSRVGRTPYRTKVRLGESVALELRKDGYLDQPVQFEVSERKSYSYAMQPSGPPR
jgi:serine/threonine protein kinase